MFAVVFIPDFCLQAVLRHEPELRARPVVLFDPACDGIVQVTAAAAQAGVTAGLTPSQAMARCVGLVIKPRSSAQEATATDTLLQTAYTFSPNIESTGPGICTMDLKGLGIDGKMAAWSEKIRQILATLHLETRIGLGPTPELALLAARGGIECLPGFGVRQKAVAIQDPVVMAQLPVAALEPSPEILQVLSRWGIRTVGEFLALDKNDIAERLGPEVLGLFERVSADAVRPLKLVFPTEHFFEEIEFEHEIETTEPLLFVLRRFVEQLSRRLETVYRVVAAFDLTLRLSSGAKYERTFKVPAPTGRVDVLFRMLQTHLETVRTDSAIVSLRLAATPARPDSHQFGLFENTLRDPNRFAETLARLTALVGTENVGTPVLEKTHRPDSFSLTVPVFDSLRTSNFELRTSGLSLRRFRPPLAARMEFQDEKPVSIRSSTFNGTVAALRGPFFSSGNWWDDQRWAREEWDVETGDGRLGRVFRSNEGCFVEGMYD